MIATSVVTSKLALDPVQAEAPFPLIELALDQSLLQFVSAVLLFYFPLLFNLDL